MFVYTSWTCVLSHDPLQGISLDEKKVFRNDPRRFKKSWIEFNFFFELFRSILFRAREQVKRSRVKDILENNRNRSEPYRTVKKNPEWIFRFNNFFSHFRRLDLSEFTIILLNKRNTLCNHAKWSHNVHRTTPNGPITFLRPRPCGTSGRCTFET